MINLIRRNLLVVVLCTSFSVISCKDVWQDHNELNIQALDKTLIEQISEDSNLSLFKTYLEQTGYDKVLASSKSFTVWAPVNSALQNLDQAIVNDKDKLKSFVGNHISYQSYFTNTPKPSLIIRMLNGKNTTFTALKFENASIVDADLYVKNGVLHTINEASVPKPNAWEYLQSSTLATKQSKFIASLERTEIDTTNGVRLFVDPVSGRTVFQEGTTFPVQRNSYFQNVSNISSEDSLITCIILTDAAFDFEINKLSSFNHTPNVLKSDSLTKFNAVKDLVIKGVFDLNSLPDSLTAVTGVKIHLDKNAVVETRQLSNGVAYVVSSIGYKLLQNKIPTVLIQGEALDSLRTPTAPVYKIQKDPSGKLFKQIQVSNITSSPSPLYYYRYKAKVYATKYAVYWRCINDIYATPISMAVKFNPLRKYDVAMAAMDYKDVPPFNAANPVTYRLEYLGEYTVTDYGDLYTFLVSSLGVTSLAPTALSLDYIKLVPIN
ncbi:fasciclin domain-containing protein [Pedobacter cryophilus]|nr:fasciclin domain-containing protein [Pedobacter cryophilus]